MTCSFVDLEGTCFLGFVSVEEHRSLTADRKTL